MANHVSAEKRNRQRIKRTDRNRAAKSTLRTEVKKARAAIKAASADAGKAVRGASSELARAASKGVVHANTASRKVSRLAARVKALSVSATA